MCIYGLNSHHNPTGKNMVNMDLWTPVGQN